MKRLLILILVMVLDKGFSQLRKKAEIANVNGIEIYYEVYGEGEPLFLLHGWTQSSQFWSEFIPTYAKHFKVYSIDLRGHGRSSQLTDSFTIEKSSLDILALSEHLKIEKFKAIGLSYGGLALLQLAALHPEWIESMIVIGASYDYNGGENTEMGNDFSYEGLPDSFKSELKATHHGGENQIRALFDPNLDYEIKLSDENLGSIVCPTLIVNGDRDEILGVLHAIELHKGLQNSELWIVPNAGHIAIIGPNKDSFLTKSVQFLKE